MDKIILTGRKSCLVTGVKDVFSFDLKEVFLETEQGMLEITGDNLHVNRLSLEKGEVDVDGDFNGIVYVEQSGKKVKSFLGKLFR